MKIIGKYLNNRPINSLFMTVDKNSKEDYDDRHERKVAYFSMEIALESDLPTYSGGLGVLSGDILRSAADLEMPVVGITLVYDNGYFYQMLDFWGNQSENIIWWDYSKEFERVPMVINMRVNGDEVNIGAWKYDIVGTTGFKVPVFLLDTNVDGNTPEQKGYTRILYDTTAYQRIIQEGILGIGGVKLLNALGYKDINTYHMNEGHSAFLTLELLSKLGDKKKVREKCAFTTHTPVPAGHDRFEYHDVRKVLGNYFREELPQWIGEDRLNMTKLGMHFSNYINAVSEKHGEVTREMFPTKEIDHITNGVHIMTWVHRRLESLFRSYFSDFNHSPVVLEDSHKIYYSELYRRHQLIKKELINYEKSHSWVFLENNLFTIGYARRITDYKRPYLLLMDLDRLGRICKGKAQIVMAGKTHPRDERGKDLIKQIFHASKYLWENYQVPLAFINNYDMDLARKMVSGCDIWLNTPRRYLEASGTSGMKAAINGVPNFSVLDGWWIEGYRLSEGKAGWAIGPGPEDPNAVHRSDEEDAEEIYDKLENEILPTYFDEPEKWMRIMKNSITLGSYFNTQRVVREYAQRAWQL